MAFRPLTVFEQEHGYSPCKLWLGERECGVDVEKIRAQGGMTVCAGTIEECRSFNNENRWRGQPIPGHPLAQAVLQSIPAVQVTFEEEPP